MEDHGVFVCWTWKVWHAGPNTKGNSTLNMNDGTCSQRRVRAAARGEMINFQLLRFLQLGPFLFPINQAACGYMGGSPTVCQFVFLDRFLHFLLLFLCVYIFFILVHHPGSKIKRSDSSSSISSQSPIGWLLSFVPLTIPQPVENGFAS